MTTLPALKIDDIETIENEPRIADLKLAVALGYQRERSIRDLIERHEAVISRFGGLCRKLRQSGGRPATEYFLNEKQALYIVAKSNTPTAAEMTVAMVEVFHAYRHGALQPIKHPEQQPQQSPTLQEEHPVRIHFDRFKREESLDFYDGFRMALYGIDGKVWMDTFDVRYLLKIPTEKDLLALVRKVAFRHFGVRQGATYSFREMFRIGSAEVKKRPVQVYRFISLPGCLVLANMLDTPEAQLFKKFIVEEMHRCVSAYFLAGKHDPQVQNTEAHALAHDVQFLRGELARIGGHLDLLMEKTAA
jgi:hypothetical protein